MTEPAFLIQGGVRSTLFENLVLRLLHVLATSARLSSYLVPCVFFWYQASCTRMVCCCVTIAK